MTWDAINVVLATIMAAAISGSVALGLYLMMLS
jgi:hypothetical protein